jgi:hypothetical protein
MIPTCKTCEKSQLKCICTLEDIDSDERVNLENVDWLKELNIDKKKSLRKKYTEYYRNWVANNKEKVREYSKKFREKNAEKIREESRERNRRLRKENREKVNNKQLEYYHKNSEKISKQLKEKYHSKCVIIIID